MKMNTTRVFHGIPVLDSEPMRNRLATRGVLSNSFEILPKSGRRVSGYFGQVLRVNRQ